MAAARLSSSVHTLDILRQEAEALVATGKVQQVQPISMLLRHLPAREWDVK